MTKSGIYKIINSKNNKFYLGSSKNIPKRWDAHKRALRKNKHDNILLQRSWNKYGEECFQFEILEETTDTILREQYYLDQLKPYDSEIGFNIGKQAFGGDNLTNHPDKDDIILRMTKSVKERYDNMSAEEKQLLSDAVKGEKNPNFGNKWNEEQRKKMSKRMIGTKASESTRVKISENSKKMWQNEDIRNKFIKAKTGERNHFYGKKHSEETKNFLREKSLKRMHEQPITNENKKNISKGVCAYYQSERGIKIRAENSKRMNEFYKTKEGEEFKQKLSERCSGEKHFLYGVGHKQESIDKMKKVHLEKWANMTNEEILNIEKIKVIKAEDKLYVGLNFAASELNLSTCALTFRCKSKNEKWSQFSFLDKTKLTPEEKSKLIFKQQQES
jgi:group I intron endonuclease